MEDDELEEKFNEFIVNFKNAPFFRSSREFDLKFLSDKFKTIPKDKKVQYIDRIQDYLQKQIEWYNQEKSEEFDTIDPEQEDREHNVSREEKGERVG